ncbi:hypothetical protein [Mucilaginibacter limnophilus]|nr:hypothetical protein [Mucilaginibacter limnophilus]
MIGALANAPIFMQGTIVNSRNSTANSPFWSVKYNNPDGLVKLTGMFLVG